jgi:hypothetical protein
VRSGIEKEPVPPPAPRKSKRKVESPVLCFADDGGDSLFAPERRLNLGEGTWETKSSEPLVEPDINWDDFLSSTNDRASDRTRQVRKAIRLLAGQLGSEAEDIPLTSLRRILSAEFSNVDSVIGNLKRVGCISVNRSRGTISMLVTPQSALTNN